MNAKPCFWKAMAEDRGEDFGKGRNGLLEEKKNPPKAQQADFGRRRSGLSLGKEKPPNAREEDFGRRRSGLSLGKEKTPKAREEDFHGGRSGLSGEKEIPPKAREADFGRWRSGLSLGKEKTPNAREADFHGGRSVMSGEKERGDLGKSSFWCGKCSALHVLAQHAASAGAARCVSHRTALRFLPHPSPSCPKAPSSSPPSASLLPCPRAGHHREGL